MINYKIGFDTYLEILNHKCEILEISADDFLQLLELNKDKPYIALGKLIVNGSVKLGKIRFKGDFYCNGATFKGDFFCGKDTFKNHFYCGKDTFEGGFSWLGISLKGYFPFRKDIFRKNKPE